MGRMNFEPNASSPITRRRDRRHRHQYYPSRFLIVIILILLQFGGLAASPTQTSVRISRNQSARSHKTAIFDADPRRRQQDEEDFVGETAAVLVPTVSPSPTFASSGGVVVILALLSFNFPDETFWDDTRLPALQIAVKEYLDYETARLEVPFTVDLFTGDRFLLSYGGTQASEGGVDVTLVVTAAEDDLAAHYIPEDMFRGAVLKALKTGELQIQTMASKEWQYDLESNGASLQISVPLDDAYPTPEPTSLSVFPTFVFPDFSYTVEIPILFSFIFPNATFWDDDKLGGMNIALNNFVYKEELLRDMDINLEIVNGNPYGIASELDYSIYGKNATDYSDSVQDVQMTAIMSFSSTKLLERVMTEDSFKVLAEEVLSNSKRMLMVEMSQSWSYDLEANGVQLAVDFLTLAPTEFPTYAPTTLAHGKSVKRRQQVRSWTFMTIFWFIVATCFALENGLCACNCFRRKKDNALDS
mmetsp:Transcript_20365/g.41658  ORF Transcript_20365/g.41658 Transcript_20365/m.41658 type:complete len:473 (-) Transcript_20365:235-1653(-)